ncbi:MAG: hypothetical protein IPP25_06430 [Saprospiraceae bacterium]|nr:hypothetical protein [Candidatus Opimibacter skivensis]
MQVVPEVVMTHDWKETPDGGELEWTATDKLGVNYSELIPLLTKAIQEQQALITQQQETINMLLRRIELVEARTAGTAGASALSYQLPATSKK